MGGIMEQHIRVLIADDRSPSRNGLRALLASWPSFEVICEAADGLEALQLAEDHQPDVVLMDVRMPMMDGLEATRLIKGRWPSIRVIALSMCARYRADALAAGADGFLVKGCRTEELLAAVSGPGGASDRAEQRVARVVMRPVCAGLSL
jgi:DNA-binding NarL/FixJ family response regulator